MSSLLCVSGSSRDMAGILPKVSHAPEQEEYWGALFLAWEVWREIASVYLALGHLSRRSCLTSH
jgi:hypothetical protein